MVPPAGSAALDGLKGGFERFAFDRSVDEDEGGAAESLVFAEDEGQVAADVRVGDGNDGEGVGAHVFGNIGAGNKTDADVGGNEALEQFAGVQFHGDLGLHAAHGTGSRGRHECVRFL